MLKEDTKRSEQPFIQEAIISAGAHKCILNKSYYTGRGDDE